MEHWPMDEALIEARAALAHEDVPVGAVVVRNGVIIGRGHNRKELEKNALCHAEMIALNEAVRHVGDWHLNDCILYVTLEPCAMCAGAMLNLRVGGLVIGARDPRMGCCGTAIDLMHQEGFNHHIPTTFGVRGEEAAALLSEFFALLRRKKVNR